MTMPNGWTTYKRHRRILPIAGAETPTIETEVTEDNSPDQTVNVSVVAPAPEAVPVAVVEPEAPAAASVSVVADAAVASFESRILSLELRIRTLEEENVALRTMCESRAEAGHEHPMPSELRALSEHLTDVAGEEQLPAPRKHPVLHRRLW